MTPGSPRRRVARRPLARVALAAALAGLVATTLPADAAPTPVTTIGSPSVPGTSKGFQLVGHTDLGNRGMNSPVAVAGRCAYVGDRTTAVRPGGGIAVVDVKDPRRPRQVGVIPPKQGVTQRELRADAGLGVLYVLAFSNTIGSGANGGFNQLQVFDIKADCRTPKLLSAYDFGVRTPHEFFVWKDPKNPGRVLAYVTTTLFAPDITVVDLTDPTAPELLTTYDTGVDQLDNAQAAAESGSGYAHSIAVSDDGTRAYLGTWDYGTYVADTSRVADPDGVPVILPLGLQKLDYGANVHGTVPLPGRPFAVMVQEDYANAGTGCPFGHLRMGDFTDPAAPVLAGEYKLPENDCERSMRANATFTAHNQTTFPSLALLTWYAGGLRAVDVSDPYRPVEAGAFVPKATKDAPSLRDTRLFFTGMPAETRRTGAMWSYPVVQDGLVYVVDIDLGLYVLRYTGKHAKQVAQAPFVEGNSSPSRYTRAAPVITRSAAVQAKVDAVRAPRVVRDPVVVASPTTGRAFDWVC
jgi:hypothetical protein